MSSITPAFERYIGIDYAGGKTPTSRLRGLRVYTSEGDRPPEAAPTPNSWNWTRKEIAEWLLQQLDGKRRTIVGIDHAFSFPFEYFERYALPLDWPAFLDDFHHHWPTDEDKTWVRDILADQRSVKRTARLGESDWKRLTEEHAGLAKSVFQFGVEGSVAHSTHAGLPWLRYLRRELGSRVHFWPFDGWDIPQGKSAIVEVYPSLWSKDKPRDGRTADQHDAYWVAESLRRADLNGRLAGDLAPTLDPDERRKAQIEGWILGVTKRNPSVRRRRSKTTRTEKFVQAIHEGLQDAAEGRVHDAREALEKLAVRLGVSL